MSNSITNIISPSAGASTKQFRISGLIFLVAALLLGIVCLAIFMELELMPIVQAAMLIPVIIWFIGMHRILWGGVLTDNKLLNIGRWR